MLFFFLYSIYNIQFKLFYISAVNILSDIIQNPILDEGAIERERGVILREMQVCIKNPVIYIFKSLYCSS